MLLTPAAAGALPERGCRSALLKLSTLALAERICLLARTAADTGESTFVPTTLSEDAVDDTAGSGALVGIDQGEGERGCGLTQREEAWEWAGVPLNIVRPSLTTLRARRRPAGSEMVRPKVADELVGAGKALAD